MTQKISLTRALVEVKTLDDRIQKAIANATFVSLSKGKTSPKPISGKYKSVDEVKDVIVSDAKSIEDLISRRSAIKAAVASANVKTTLTIGGVLMTIVEAIDAKHVIEYRKAILGRMMFQLQSAANNVEASRTNIEKDVQAAIERLLGGEVKNKEAVAQNDALITSTKGAILDMHELTLIDPNNIRKGIEALQMKISDVENEIDFALSEINAKTEIEIS